MPLRPNMEPQEYLELFLRRKWLILFSIVIVMLGVAVYCVAVPDRYVSTATIMVIPPSVSANYVRSVENYPLQDRLQSMQHQVLSRTRLIAVMDDLGLFKEFRKKTSLEVLVGRMQKHIEVTGIKGKNAFSLSFEHEDPKLAMLTVSKLASFFIDENNRAREQKAVNTSEFLESQLKETKAKLEAQEEKIKHYKLQFMGELPQQMQANLTTMSRIQEQIRTNTDSTSRLEDRKVYLESKLGELQKEIATVDGQSGALDDPAEDLLADISIRQKKIRELSMKFTSKYPTVIQLEREVEDLKKKVESVRTTGPAQNESPVGTKSPKAYETPRTTEARRLREQIANLNLEIASLKRENDEARKSIDTIQKKVGRLPQREQEMISLTRDYENIKEAYEGLMKKRLDAKVSQNLEEDQMGETFQVIDPANLPMEPSKPDRLKILAISFLAAIAIGFAGSIGFEMMDMTLRSTKDFKCFFEFPILGALPVLQEDQDIRTKQFLRTALLIGTCSFLSAVTVCLLVYRQTIQAALKINGVIG